MKYMNFIGKTMVSVAVLAAFGGANAAQNGRASMANSNPMRMPTIPTVSLNTLGNPAVNTVSTPAGVSDGIPNPIPTPTPTPTPTPSPCADGGVQNSDYTISMCMDDLLQCINTGALQGGINDLFNYDVRNSIMSGMKLCQPVVDKCIKEVRVNCRNIYLATTDVWLDFNSRVIQPEYYNFVLRKTGLTPNQAENTCLLLDRNTYGTSFASVSDTNAVNTEYNKRVGAYNEALNGTLSKNNPQGVEVNTTGYDGNRGHYARWDASKGECLIRVAAYNKDNLITNSWLFGAIGDDTPAEVWQKAGGTFTCNKELFDFKSLLNQTKTAAVIGVGGGTVLGTAIGAAAGAGAYKKKAAAAEEADEPISGSHCKDEAYRKKLGSHIMSIRRADVINSYMVDPSAVSIENDKIKVSTDTPRISNFYELKESDCNAIHALYQKAELYKDAIAKCRELSTIYYTSVPEGFYRKTEFKTKLSTVTCEGGTKCGDQVAAQVAENCLFVPLQVGLAKAQSDIFCKGDDSCLTAPFAQKELNRLNTLLSEIEPVIALDAIKEAKAKPLNKGAEIGKGAAIGAVTGAGVGGIVTGITALVEKNNITCRVGDGLNTISLGKSHTIDSLKDFYVKWNLKLPDTVAPTAVVVDVASWQQACSQFNNRLMDCPYVQVNLQLPNAPTYQLINAACVQSGSVCIPNQAAINSNLP